MISLRTIRTRALQFAAFAVHLDVLDPKDIESVFRAASKGRADALLVLGSPVLVSKRTQVVELALKNRLPTVCAFGESVKAGCLMSYPSVPMMVRHQPPPKLL